MNYSFIKPDKIKNMLFNEAEYVIEFCEAGVKSIEEFIQDYDIHLLNRDMASLRKAGHKIKPGAQMMGADVVVERYEQGKKLLKNEAAEEMLSKSANEMTTLGKSIQEELTQLAASLK